MRTLSTRARVVVTAMLVCTWGVLAACSEEEENPAPNRPRTGTDSGTPGVSPTNSEGGVIGAAICAKYGGTQPVKVLATKIIDTGKADCRISPEMTGLTPQEQTTNYECFQNYLAAVFQCDGQTFTLGTTTDLAGKIKCNSYLPHITFTTKDFEAFDEDAKAALVAGGVSADDLKSIAPAIQQMKLNLVKKGGDRYGLCAPNCAKGGPACIPLDGGGPIDAGGDTGTPPQDSGTPQDAAADGG